MTIKYDLEGFQNLREGGGMKARGGRVRTGRLLRCDFPTSLDAEDIEFFKELPTRAVIDLRDTDEMAASPRYFADAGLPVVERPIFAGSIASIMEGGASVEKLYLHMLQGSAKQLGQAVHDVAQALPDGAVVVHCTAGKDRTGVVIALVQAVLGVSDEEIVENYRQSQKNLSGEWLQQKIAQLRQAAKSHPELAKIDVSAFEPLMVGSPPEAIMAMLSQVRAQSGSVEQFLIESGVTNADLEQIRAALIDTSA